MLVSGEYVVEYCDRSWITTLVYSEKYKMFNAYDWMDEEKVAQVSIHPSKIRLAVPTEKFKEYVEDHPSMDKSGSGKYVVILKDCKQVFTTWYSNRWGMFNCSCADTLEEAEEVGFANEDILWSATYGIARKILEELS